MQLCCVHCRSTYELDKEASHGVSMGSGCPRCGKVGNYCIACGKRLPFEEADISYLGTFVECLKCGFSNPVMKTPDFYEENFSMEVCNFFLYRRKRANISHLKTAYEVIIALENQLDEKRKALRFATPDDVQAFLENIQKRVSRTSYNIVEHLLLEFYDILEGNGTLVENPVYNLQEKKTPRLPWVTNATMVCSNRLTLKGHTVDASRKGARLLIFQGLEGAEAGMVGLLGVEFTRLTGSVGKITLPARILRVEQTGIVVRLYSYDDMSGGRIIPNNTYLDIVRSDGRIEDNWQMVPLGTVLPGIIQQKIKECRDSGPLIVCSKNETGQSVYRVIPLLELGKGK